MDFKNQNLQIRIRSLEKKIEDYESGKEVQNLEKKHEKEIRALKIEHRKEIAALEKSHRESLQNARKKQKELLEQIEEKERSINSLKSTVLSLEKEIHHLKTILQMNPSDSVDPALQKIIDRQNEMIEKMRKQIQDLEDSSRLKDELIRIQKKQIDLDYTNSSLPSSQKPDHKTINGRKPTGKKPGAQKGHDGHKRKDLAADRIIELTDLPEEAAQNPEDYEKTDLSRSRKLVSIHLEREVTEYRVYGWRNRKTGRIVYGNFPSSCPNEISYDESVKALLCVLTCYMNVSIRKAAELIETLTEGALTPSSGMICHLREEFRLKSKKERQEIWNRLQAAPYMNVDTTFTRIDGKMGYMGICCTDSDIYYNAGMHKGGKLAEESPLSGYSRVSVHDGEAEFFRHGSAHQQCLAHLFRYLLQIEQAEPQKTWAVKMNELLHEISSETEKRKAERKATGEDITSEKLVLFSEEEIREYIRRYDAILDLADSEYSEKPKEYVVGYNTKNRLREQKDSVLYFLNHPYVPWHNNQAEQGARTLKRKTRQSDGFRSLEGARNEAAILTVIISARKKGENILKKCEEIFRNTIAESQA